jgi:hypothetical protein
MGFKLRPGTSVFGNVTFTPGTNENYVAPTTQGEGPEPAPTPSVNWVIVTAERYDNELAGNIGAVYFYDANDLSAQPIRLNAFDAAANDYFGKSVTVSDDKIVVGAERDDGAGSAYVYDINDLTAQPIKLTPFDGVDGDRFGISVAATADKIVVGAYYDDDNGSNSGSVYVYDTNDLTAQATKLTAFDGASSGVFGYSVAVNEDKIFVGAYGDADNGNRSGSVYVYDVNDLSAQPTKLTAFDGAAQDFFGYSVAVNEDKIFVGAHGDDDNGSKSGSVYVYDANDLSAQPIKLNAFDATSDDAFGSSISATADKIVVGAYLKDEATLIRAGAVYVYDANDLSAQPTKLTAFDGDANDYFGRSVATSDDKIVVGAYGDADNGGSSGSVYTFDANDLSAQPTKLTAFDGAAGDYFGLSVAIG